MRVALEVFSPAVRDWFETSFDAPTRAQRDGWKAIAAGDHALILAPTGSGKTLAAFLWAIDRLSSSAPPEDPKRGTRVLYVSPLRALAVDIEKNLRAPLAGIQACRGSTGHAAGACADGRDPHRRHPVERPPTDDPAPARHPDHDARVPLPDAHLFREGDAPERRTVIVDEIHAMAASKRGAHLALSLERLEELCDEPPQRIGLSATQRPLEEIARFLGGSVEGVERPVTIVDAGHRKPMELQVVVPVEDMGGGIALDARAPARDGDHPRRQGAGHSIWPSIHPRLLELIREHRSTIVFTNARRLAERLAASLNELAGEDLVRAHHGSLAREQRLEVEDALKEGRLRAIVATSSLELGIDMGAVDLVIQVESPGLGRERAAADRSSRPQGR